MGLDAIELLMTWEEVFAVEFDDAEAETIETPAIAIELISQKLNVPGQKTGVCPTLRAFNHLRYVLQSITHIPRQAIQLNTCLDDLILKTERQAVKEKLCSTLGISKLPIPTSTWMWCSPNIQKLVDHLVTHYPQNFIDSDGCWTRNQIRSIVRATLRDQMEVPNVFSDEVNFHREFA